MEIDAEISQSVTTQPARKIEAINRNAVHQICSGQVVLNLATAVKELVENSLDAGASVIEIRLKDYGSELIEVSDNGSGVEEHNFQALTLKHHTSKLRDFSDLVSVETFGFRGEALSSLCALSEVSIITRHVSATCGTKLDFDNDGNIINQKQHARQVGTTVSLQNIFSSLPVRHKEFHRNLKREFSKMSQILYAYCLVATGVRINCINVNNKGGRTTVVSTQGGKSVRENIACVFGTKQLQSLLELTQEVPDENLLEEVGVSKELVQGTNPFNLEGFLSSCSHGQGRAATDRQFFYINSRPCEPSKVIKTVNDTYHQFNSHQYPFVFLDIKTVRKNVDVNVTPDKRQVFLENEKLLMCTVKVIKTVNDTYHQFNSHQYPFVFLDIKTVRKNVDVNVTPDKRQVFLENEELLMCTVKVIKTVNDTYHQFNSHQYPFVFLDIKTVRKNVDVNVTPDKRQVFLENEKLLMCTVKVIKTVNDTYHQFNSHQYPFVFLDIKTVRKNVDVNVTPDKRQVFLENEKLLMCTVKVIKTVNDTYHQFNSHQYPFVFLDIKTVRKNVDVNVTPDKRQVFLENEKLLMCTVKVIKTVNDTYHQFNSHQYPFVFLDIKTVRKNVDVNVTPDKRQVFLENEKLLMCTVKVIKTVNDTYHQFNSHQYPFVFLDIKTVRKNVDVNVTPDKRQVFLENEKLLMCTVKVIKTVNDTYHQFNSHQYPFVFLDIKTVRKNVDVNVTPDKRQVFLENEKLLMCTVKVIKTVNDTYHQFNSHQYPFVFLDIKTVRKNVDVNVTPDKRQVFLENEKLLMCTVKVIKTVNDTYHQFNSHQYPFVFLDIKTVRKNVDVNVTPDKRQVFLENEKLLMCTVKVIKTVNDTYHQFNSHQYPFVFLDIKTVRKNVDVNVTPDKRQVFLENEKLLMCTVKVIKTVNDTYHQFNSHQYPFVFLDIKTVRKNVDVNVTPDKRQVFLENEKLLMCTVKVIKTVNDTYHQFNSHQYPFVFLDIKTVRKNVDVNVTPDKRQVFLENEKLLMCTVKVIKTVNDTYHQFNSHQYPFVFLDIKTVRKKVDVNVTPDKRQVFLENEKLLICMVKFQNIPVVSPTTSTSPSTTTSPSTHLSKLLKNWSRSPESVSPGRGTKRSGEISKRGSSKSPKQFCMKNYFKSKIKSGLESRENSADRSVDDNTRVSTVMLENDDCNTGKMETFPRDTEIDDTDIDTVDTNVCDSSAAIECSDSGLSLNISECSSQDLIQDKMISQTDSDPGFEIQDIIDLTGSNDSELCDLYQESDNVLKEQDDDDQNKTCESTKEIVFYKPKSLTEDPKLDLGKPDRLNRQYKNISVSMVEIEQRLKARNLRKKHLENKNDMVVKFHAEIDPSKNSVAEDELRKEISKEMFSQMKVIGQFNLGFIVTQLGPDLFIIDQHATDEKYNFEMLQKTTTIQNQKLVIPQTLELTAVNESILIENKEIFERNGFDLIIDEEAETTKRVQLSGIPMSKNWHFGKEDVDELLFMLQDSPHTMCRPSRIRAMFASRACRKSVMIGKALSYSDMRKLVSHMGEIDQPWNCPHGRPTMRHLINLHLIKSL